MSQKIFFIDDNGRQVDVTEQVAQTSLEAISAKAELTQAKETIFSLEQKLKEEKEARGSTESCMSQVLEGLARFRGEVFRLNANESISPCCVWHGIREIESFFPNEASFTRMASSLEENTYLRPDKDCKCSACQEGDAR